MMDRKQTTVRFPESLYEEFTARVADLGENVNGVLQRLVAEWLENLDRGVDQQHPSRIELLKHFLRCLPAACAIKIQGRVIFANPEFRRLFGPRKELIGALPSDYWDDPAAARHIMECDRITQERAVPILCVDRIGVNGPAQAIRDRLTIKFPILDRARQRVEAIGVIGFDFKQMSEAAQALKPGAGIVLKADYAREFSQGSTVPDSLLLAFIDSVPAIATVKNLESQLLSINREFAIVTGRGRRDVLGHRPSENWPNEIGSLIERHDKEVKESKAPIISVESIPTKHRGVLERLNVRFPIFDSNGEQTTLNNIGTIGFDFKVVKKGIDLLRQPENLWQAYVFLPAEKPDSMKPLSIYA